MYTRARREFGRQPKFSDSSAQLCVDVTPNPVEKDYMVKRNSLLYPGVHRTDLSEHECNTETFQRVGVAKGHQPPGGGTGILNAYYIKCQV